MRNWKLVILGGLAMGGVGLSSEALAGGEGKHGGSFVDHEMKAMDTNGDQQVSADEHVAGVRKMFDTMDVNKNGKVTAEEMAAGHQRVTGQKDNQRADQNANLNTKKTEFAAAKIKTCDGDNDGELSADEHTNCARTMFGKMDTNKDGQLTRTELTSGHAKMMPRNDKTYDKTTDKTEKNNDRNDKNEK